MRSEQNNDQAFTMDWEYFFAKAQFLFICWKNNPDWELVFVSGSHGKHKDIFKEKNSLKKLLHPMDLSVLESKIVNHDFSKTLLRFEDSEKQWIWIELFIQPDSSKSKTTFCAFIFDRTLEMAMESAMLGKNSQLEIKTPHSDTLRTLNQILDKMEASIYISDLETYEILYMNEYLKKRLGPLHSNICWKLLQNNQNRPCSFCNNAELIANPEKTISWQHYNTKEGKWYKLYDSTIRWLNQRLVRLSIGLDITELKLAQEKLHLWDKVQNAVSKVTHQLIESRNISQKISSVLETLGQASNADRVYIIRKNMPDEPNVSFFADWSQQRNGLFNSGNSLSYLDFNENIFSPWIERLKNDEIILARVETVSSDIHKIMKFLNIQSILLIPIFLSGKWWGFIGFNTYFSMHEWSETEIEILQSAARVIGSVLEREKNEQEIKDLNINLGARVRQELMQNREKDHLLMAQSRLAGLGEMIGNIAHQWRQPLTVLGLIVQNLNDDFDFGELTKEKMNKAENEVMNIVKHMSHTIDDFRDFFKPNKEKIPFLIYKDSLSKVMGFVEARLKSYNVSAEITFEEDIRIMGYPNEYSQVFMNIINNAVDTFIERKIQFPKLSVSLKKEKKQSLLQIQDNAGGIDHNILHRIFDPYFSTKEKGTGIGLYMSKMIIEEHMGGSLSVANKNDGALFNIYV